MLTTIALDCGKVLAYPSSGDWFFPADFPSSMQPFKENMERAMAFLNGRHFVTPQDVKTVAMDVLRHRVTVTYEAEAEDVTSRHIIERILNTLPVP